METNGLWTTKEGVEVEVSKMSDSHILNSYKMLKRKRKEYIGLKTLEFYLNCTPPIGEMAKDAFEEELNRILESPGTEFIDLFEDELKRRGIKYE